jgi:glycine/D-amino acid oxidase-like deaminating enzyme
MRASSAGTGCARQTTVATVATCTSVNGNAELPVCAPLAADVATDVCVIGAGIVGMTTAYLLAQAGRRVVVLEAGEVGGGNTGRTTAHLSNALDDRYHELVRIRGREHASMAYRAHTAAIDGIAAIVRSEAIDCAFERVDGHLVLAPGQDGDELDKELAACREIGFTGGHCGSRTSALGGPALRFPDQAQFHPLRYLAGLVRAVLRDGGQICTRTRARPRSSAATSRGRDVRRPGRARRGGRAGDQRADRRTTRACTRGRRRT